MRPTTGLRRNVPIVPQTLLTLEKTGERSECFKNLIPETFSFSVAFVLFAWPNIGSVRWVKHSWAATSYALWSRHLATPTRKVVGLDEDDGDSTSADLVGWDEQRYTAPRMARPTIEPDLRLGHKPVWRGTPHHKRQRFERFPGLDMRHVARWKDDYDVDD